jgi:hypothetical protein
VPDSWSSYSLDDGPALCCAELSELLDLVGGVLAFVLSGDTGIEGGSHAKPPIPLEMLELAIAAGRKPGGRVAAKVRKSVQTGEAAILARTLSTRLTGAVSLAIEVSCGSAPNTGLDRYDGYNFKVFVHESGNPMETR